MIISGHRGGFKPDNCLMSFKKARDNKLQAIELDIWITKDNELAVIHGGYDGEMPPKIGEEDAPKTYIYNLTLLEAQNHLYDT